MTSPPPTEFSNQFLAIAGEPLPFKPHSTYDKDGDCVEFLAKPGPFYGERIDDLVTVYRSQADDEVVGALIKGVKRFCQKTLDQYPGFGIEIQDGKVKLACLFRAKAWATPKPKDKVLMITYRKLIEAAEAAEAETEMCEIGA